ncbi:MAG: hypothetical protein RIR51_1897 [Bacteroidota bacterium]|jgi:hypothetical protein
MNTKLSLTLISFLIFSCTNEEIKPISKTFSKYFFTLKDNEGWIQDFADYPYGMEEFYELSYGLDTIPFINYYYQTELGLKQSGNNHSDDLFMFVKKKINGLDPNTDYYLSMELEFASNAPNGSVGVGGSPGESVFIKAGGSTFEPKKVLDPQDNYYRMNIDKGNQAESGKDMILLGNFSNESNDSSYFYKSLNSKSKIIVRSDENGSAWIIFGVDSGFEATTTIYYYYVKAIFENK